MQTLLAEVVGTLLLVLLGDGVVANVVLNRTKGQNAGWVVITLGWGVAVAMAVYAVGRISGAHLNPAVTVGLAAIGSFNWADVPGYIAAQMLGAFLGAILVWLMYLPHWAVTSDPGAKLAVFATGPAIRNPAANFIGELIGTAVLVFGILAIAANAQTLNKPGDVDLSFVFSRGTAAFAGRRPGAGHRLVARRSDRLRDQSGARPGTAPGACHPADSRQGYVGLGVCVDSRRRAARRRRGRRGTLLSDWFLTLKASASDFRGIRW